MKKRAFTIVELLVVIGIVALLLSIVIPAVRRARQQSQQQEQQSQPSRVDQPRSQDQPVECPNAEIVAPNVLKFPSVHRSGKKVFDLCLRRWQEKHSDMEVVSMSSQPGDGDWAVWTYVVVRKK